MGNELLRIEGLHTEFATRAGVVKAVDGIDLSLRRGEILGLVGESGSGKSVTGFSIIGLIDEPGRVTAGRIVFDGHDLVAAGEPALARLRGSRIAMIFQDPMMTLNPVLRIDTQMVEAIRAHADVSRDAAWRRARDALGLVGIPSPEERLRAYPHQFSGGMRQRVVIAIAMLHAPDLIIADEPTTALDVTIQAQILYEMQRLRREREMALLWITHDLSVDCRTRRPRGGHVRGTHRRAGRRRRCAGCAGASVHPGPDRIDSESQFHGRSACPDSRHDALPDRHRAGLPIPRALPAGDPSLRRRSGATFVRQ